VHKIQLLSEKFIFFVNKKFFPLVFDEKNKSKKSKSTQILPKKMSSGFSKEATWDNYAKHMIHSKSAQLGSFGWIVGQDGTVYGTSPNAPVLTQEEGKSVGTAGPGMGLTIAGTKYQILRAMEETVLGKKGKANLVILKSKQINLVAIITEEDGDKFTPNNLLGPMENIHREFGKQGW
jgi:hypothetical protein